MSRPDHRKRRLAPDKPVTPEVYKASLAGARERSMKRAHGPIISLEPGSSELAPPFSDHGEDWRYIVVDTFGTRSHDVASVFIDQLTDLVGSAWNDETKEWIPEAAELTTLLHVVAAHRPRNEAQAMLAAQIAAAHILTMKVAARAAQYPWDNKTVSSFAKLACTSAVLIDAMGRMQGKRRTSKQSITVRQEKHVHYHQHAHVRGAPKNERQPQEPCVPPESIAALPGPDEGGTVVPLAGRERKARL
jgi:hypothetical protein